MSNTKKDILGQHTNGKSALKITYPIGLPGHMRKNIREVTSLYTGNKFRGKGYASKLLQEVCISADKHAIVLLIAPKPFDNGLDQEQLISFYSRHGFVKIQDNPVLMARQNVRRNQA